MTIENDKLFTVIESAAYLKVNKVTVRRWLNSGTLEGVKVGGRWRIKASSLEKVLKGGEKP